MSHNFGKKVIRSLLAFFLVFQGSVAHSLSYDVVANKYMSSFPVVVAPEPVDEDALKTINFSIPTLETRAALEKIFNLFSEFSVTQYDTVHEIFESIINKVADELELFRGVNDLTVSLMSKIDRTQTLFGRVALAKMLSCPLTDFNKLRSRQALIMKLAQDPVLFKKVERALKAVKKSEQILFSYFNVVDEKDLFKKAADKLSFGSRLKGLNKNQYALETKTRLRNLKDLTWFAGTEFLLFTGFHYLYKKGEYAANKKEKPWRQRPLPEPSVYNSVSAVGSSLKNGVAAVLNRESWKEWYADWAAEYDLHCKMAVDDGATKAQFAIAYCCAMTVPLSIVSALLYWRYSVKKSIVKNVLQERDVANVLQEKLISVATFVDSIAVMNKSLLSEKEFCDGLPACNEIKKLFNKKSKISKGLRELISLLQTSTFDDQASFFSLTGRVLAADNIMQELKNELVPAMEAVGEIDACLSMARLYKEYANKNVRYSFVEFVEKDEPYVALQGCWNPFVDTSVVVTNDITFGGGTDVRNIILTGSNTGGKSTMLKAITIDMVLAHTFGIAAASSASVTPMYCIGTSMNVSDSIGTSKFKAEALRAQSIKKAIASVPKGQFCFFVVDELFAGTNAAVGSAELAKFVKKLAQIKHCVLMLATHFPSVTSLEDELGSLCVNFKMDVIKNERGKIKHTFKLARGISEVNIAADIIKDLEDEDQD